MDKVGGTSEEMQVGVTPEQSHSLNGGQPLPQTWGDELSQQGWGQSRAVTPPQ